MMNKFILNIDKFIHVIIHFTYFYLKIKISIHINIKYFNKIFLKKQVYIYELLR